MSTLSPDGAYRLDSIHTPPPDGFVPLGAFRLHGDDAVQVGAAAGTPVIVTLDVARQIATETGRPELMMHVEQYTVDGLCPCCLSGGHPLARCPGMEPDES